MAFNNEKIFYLESSDFDGEGNLKVNPAKPVLVMIYGDGCPHCHYAMPEYIKLANEYDGAMYCAIVTDGELAEADLLSKLASIVPSLRGIPTFVLFRNGKYVKTFQGARVASELKKFIDS